MSRDEKDPVDDTSDDTFDEALQDFQLKILFVDDESDLERLIRLRYRRLIRSGDIFLEFAKNGAEAISKLEEDDDIAIVMTDINMPVMDGLTLLGEIGQRYQDMPVVIISAYGDMKNIRTAMNRGAFDFLTKPIEFEDLEVTRKKAMGQYKKLRRKVYLEREKRRLKDQVGFIRETFGRYLSDAVVEQILESPGGLQLGGEKRDVSVLISDLRGFSALAERLEPAQSVAILNNYFESMIDVIFKHRGTIDELLGDSILVIFGAPFPQDDHPQRAASCAIAMQQAMQSVNDENLKHGLPAVEMGIGISTGEVVVGNIGSKKRTKYGIVGTNVNLAARIESRTIGGQVLISENTYRACESKLDIGDEIEFIAKGYRDPIKTYDLRGIAGDPNLKLPKLEIHLTTLTKAVPVRFAVLTDHDSESYRNGEFLRLSTQAGEIRSAEPPEDWGAPVRVQILDTESDVDFDELYGKVVSTAASEKFTISFTSLPPEVRKFLEEKMKSP